MATSTDGCIGPMQDIERQFPQLKDEDSYELLISFGNKCQLPYILTSSGRMFAFHLKDDLQGIINFFNAFQQSLGIVDEDVMSVKVRFAKDEIESITTERVLHNVHKFVDKLSEYTLKEFI